jgi:hypothetical protein
MAARQAVEAPGPGLRFLPLRVGGGVSSGASRGATGGFATRGLDLQSAGGEGTLMAYEGFVPEGGGWVSDVTAVHAPALYGCRDRYDATSHPPVAALVAPCRPSWIGFGGTVLRARHLSPGNELLLRPIAMQATVHFAGPAYTAGYWRHRVRLFFGGALDVVADTGRVSPLAYGGAQLRFGSVGHGWSLEPEAVASVDARARMMLEARTRLGFGWRTGPAAAPWGTLKLGIDGGLIRQRQAEKRIPFLVSALRVSARTSWTVQGYLSWVWDALVL